jgi:hypothetical protein
VLRKEQDRLTKELRGIGAALAAFGKTQQGNNDTNIVQVSMGEDRSRPESAMGESPRERRCAGQGSSDTVKADTLGICAKKDRSGAEGAMGQGEGGEKDGLRLD